MMYRNGCSTLALTDALRFSEHRDHGLLRLQLPTLEPGLIATCHSTSKPRVARPQVVNSLIATGHLPTPETPLVQQPGQLSQIMHVRRCRGHTCAYQAPVCESIPMCMVHPEVPLVTLGSGASLWGRAPLSPILRRCQGCRYDARVHYRPPPEERIGVHLGRVRSAVDLLEQYPRPTHALSSRWRKFRIVCLRPAQRPRAVSALRTASPIRPRRAMSSSQGQLRVVEQLQGSHMRVIA